MAYDIPMEEAPVNLSDMTDGPLKRVLTILKTKEPFSVFYVCILNTCLNTDFQKQ